MAWLSKNNFSPSDSIAADDLNNLANDMRAWQGDVNGGGHHLSNVIIDNYFPGAGVPLLSPIHIIPTSTDYSSQLRLDSEVAGNPARWIIIKDQSAETGINNAGSNFAIYRCADNGTTIDSPISINRSSGITTLGAQQWAGNVNGGGFTLTNVIIPSVFQDPTTTLGDLIVRGASATGRFGIGTADGMVLQVDSTQPFKMKWAVSPAVPYTRQILTPAGSGLSGGGDLSQDRSLAADVLSVAGKKGAVTLAVADVAGAVPNTRSVLAGAGMTGGGALSADVTLNANVISVANKTGAVSLVAADVSGAVPSTRQIIAGAGIAASTTSDLSKDVTVTALVTSVFGRTGAVNINATDIANGGGVPATRNILTPTGSGLSGGGPLSADLSLAVVNNSSIQKVNWASGSGSVVGARSTLNFIPGSNINITLADNAVSDRMDVTLNGTGVTAIWSNGTLIGNRPAINFIAGSNVTISPSDNSTQNRVDITFSAVGGTGGGAGQSPWTTPIDAAGNTLTNVANIGVNRSLDLTTRIAIQANTTETGVRVANASATSAAMMEVDNDNATAKLVVEAYGSTFGGSLQATSGLNALAGPMTFAINSSEAMRVSTGKRILIGTATDDGANLLQVNGKIKSLSGGIVFPDGTTQITAGITTAGQGQTPWLTDIDAASHNLLHLNSINSGGPALGIGTLTPTTAALHVVNSQALAWTIMLENYGGLDAVFRGRVANGTPASPTAATSGQVITGIRGLGYNGSAWTSAMVTLDMVAAETWTPSANGTYIALTTTAKGATAGAERMRITDSGLVGIGVTNPTSVLQVTAPNSSGAIGTGILIASPASQLSLTAGNAVSYVESQFWDLAFKANGERMRITSAGLVGIGTASPSYPLEIVGAVTNQVHVAYGGSGGQIFLSAGSSGIATALQMFTETPLVHGFAISMGLPGSSSASDLLFASYSGGWTERMRITSAGLIGINNASPKSTLDVTGNIRMSGVRSTLFYHGDATDTGGLQIVGSASAGVIVLTPTDDSGTPLNNAAIRFGGAGYYNSSPVNLQINGNVMIGPAPSTAPLYVKLGTVGDSTGQPAGTWASIIYNATNAANYNGLLVKNNWQASTSTVFQVGADAVGAAFVSYMVVNGSGNVGIGGTTTPGSLLTLQRNVSGGIGPIFELRNAAGAALDAVAIRMYDWDSNPRGELRMMVNGPTYGTDFIFLTGGGAAAATEIMRLTNDGKLAIGNTGTAALLMVGPGPMPLGSYCSSPYFQVGTAYAMPATVGTEAVLASFSLITPNVSQLNVRARRSAAVNSWPQNDFIISHDVDASPRAGAFIVLSGGNNVGVCTLSPAYRLDIAGDCNITGTYRINGTPISTSGAPGAWTAYTAAVTDQNSAAITLTANACSYCIYGSLLFIQFNLGYTGTAATGTVNVSLPVSVTGNCSIAAYQHLGGAVNNNVVDMVVGANTLTFYMGAGTQGIGVGLKIGGVLRIT